MTVKAAASTSREVSHEITELNFCNAIETMNAYFTLVSR